LIALGNILSQHSSQLQRCSIEVSLLRLLLLGVSSSNRVTNLHQEPKEFNRDSRGQLSNAGFRNLQKYPQTHTQSVRSEPPQRRAYIDPMSKQLPMTNFLS